MALKPPITPLKLAVKQFDEKGKSQVDSSQIGDEFYFKNTPPNSSEITAISSVNIRMPFYRNSANSIENSVSFENLYREGDSDKVANILVKGGAINKALKYSLLYNYFGYPVANITSDSNNLSESPESADTYQFTTQNKYDYKPYLYGYAYSKINNDNANLYTTYRAAGIPTRQVYQLGRIGQLPDFGSISNKDDLKLAYENNTYKSFQDLDNDGGFNGELNYKIFQQIHGSYEGPSPIGGGLLEQTYVDIIGFSPEASFFASHNNNGSLYIYKPQKPLGENIDNGKLLGSFKGDSISLPLSVASGEMLSNYDESQILELVKGGDAGVPSIQDAQQKLFGSTSNQDSSNYSAFLDAVMWKKFSNPINKTYCRAWLPSFQGTRFGSFGLTNDSYGPDPQIVEGGAGTGLTFGQDYQYSQVSQMINHNLTWKGNYNYDIDTLGMILGQYGATGWYEYINQEGLVNELDIENQSINGTPDDFLKQSYDKFSKENLASMYKIIPGSKVLNSGTNSGNQNEVSYYVANPARTLNKIMPYVMKYITEVVPSFTTAGAADEWKSGDGALDNNLNTSDVISKLKTSIEPSDLLRKFRFSTEDMTEYDNSDVKGSLGYTHRVGDLGKSGEELGLNQARNRLTIATPSISQREYLTQGSIGGGTGDYPALIESYYSYVDYLPFDKNFTYNYYSPKDNGGFRFLADNLVVNLANNKSNGSSEFAMASTFSLFLLSQMYLKLPPYYYKSQDIEGYYANSILESGTSAHGGVEMKIKVSNKWLNMDESDGIIITDTQMEPGKKNVYGGSAINYLAQSLYTDGFKGNDARKELTSLTNLSGEGTNYGFLGLGSLTFPPSLYPEFANENPAIALWQSEEISAYWDNPPDEIGPYGKEISVEVKGQSDLTFPVWNYSGKDLDNINWKTISEYEDKVEDLQSAINENSQIGQVINYGIPEWVRGLRIYPTLDSETTITNLQQSEFYDDGASVVAAMNQAPVVEGSGEGTILRNYKTSNSKNIKDKIISGVKFVIEPTIHESSEMPVIQGIGDNSVENFYGEHKSYAELKYAVEIDIDERKLLMDMASQGIIAFAGNLGDYEDLGFDIEELLYKSNGNVVSPSLADAYEQLTDGFSTISGYDFSKFPSLVSPGTPALCGTDAPQDVKSKAQGIKSTTNDPFVCTSYVCLNETGAPSVALKSSPGTKSGNMGYLADKTIVKVLKEWVNGKGEFNKVHVTDTNSPLSGSTGYISPEVLKSIRFSSEEPIFFEERFSLPLAETIVQMSSEMAKALNPSWWKIPQNSIAETSEPYLHLEAGEYHYPVTLDTECIIDEEDFEKQKLQAKKKGLVELFNYYDKDYNESDIENFIQTYLAVRIDDDGYYVDSRPGAKVMMLLKVGGVYLNAIPTNTQSLENLKNAATKVISLNTNWYQLHLQQAVYALNKLYLDMYSSEYTVPGFNFFKESKRLSSVPLTLKKVLAANGYETNPSEENVFNLGFNDAYELIYISYKEKGKNEKLMNLGFNHLKNSEPFVFPYTMSLLYHHRQLKNPLLKWQIIFKEWLPVPRPKIILKEAGDGDFPISKCSPWMNWVSPSLSKLWDNALGQLSEALDLDPRYDLGAFQFNLLQYFPPCPRPAAGRGPGYLNFVSQINGQSQIYTEKELVEGMSNEINKVGEYVGDWLSSGEALKDVQSKIFDMDDLYTYVLNYITPELLYSKICKCFLDLMDVDDISVPNLEINATGGSGGLTLNPDSVGKNPKEMLDIQGPEMSTSFLDEDGNYKEWKDWDRTAISAEDLFCSFCFRMPSVFLRLPSTDILAELINALKAALEFALAQILMQLVASLLEILLTCPELQCGPEENVGRVQDFGALNLSDLMGDVDFDKCGLLIDGKFITQEKVDQMLIEISNSLTTTEVLGLIEGNASSVVIKTANQVINKYPNIRSAIPNPAMIEDFFLCAGSKIDPNFLDQILDDTAESFQDPTVCSNILEETKQKLLDKCGTLPNAIEVANKALNHDINKYKEIARIIRENDDLSNQLPPLFTDGKGAQSILSGIKFDTLDFALDNVIDNLSIPIETQLNIDCNNFFNPLSNRFVKDNGGASLYDLDVRDFLLWRGFGDDDSSNTLAGLVTPDEVTPIDSIVNNVAEYVKSGEFQFTLQPPEAPELQATIKMNPPQTKDGELIYTNNLTLFAQRPPVGSNEGNTIQFNLSSKEFAPDIKEFLEKNEIELYSNQIPEQVQVFAALMSKSGGISDFLSKDALAEFYSIVLSSLTNGIGNTLRDTNILETYSVKPTDKVTLLGDEGFVQVLKLSPIFLLADSSLDKFIDEFYPVLTRNAIEDTDLTTLPATQAKNNPYSSGIVDFEEMKRVIKNNYDFSREADQTSDSIQMPQKAFLNGLVHGFMQIFAGEVFAKACYYLPYFPHEVFSSNSELLIEYIFDVFETNWLNTAQQEEFKPIWKSTVCRLVAEKAEFVPDSDSDKLPRLPGEVGSEFAAPTEIKGSIYDMNLGIPVRIENWKDATKYFIRQGYEGPLRFIKNKIQGNKLKTGSFVNNEANPFDFMAFKSLKQIHHRNLNFETEQGYNWVPSSISKEDQFKTGRFFIQYYYELEELDKFVTPDADSGEVNELFNVQFVNRTPDLKGKISPQQFVNLINQLIPPGGNSQMGFGYDNKFKSKKIKDFFKSIKIGLRFCYGLRHYNTISDAEQEGINDYDKVKDSIDFLVKEYQKALDSVALTEAIDESIEGEFTEDQQKNADLIYDFTNFIRREKSFVIFENVGTKYDLDSSDPSEPFEIDGKEGEFVTQGISGTNLEFLEEELFEAFYQSETGDNPSGTVFGYAIDKLIEKTGAKVSFVFPIISRSEDVTDDKAFNKKLYNVAESYEGNELERILDFFERPTGVSKTQKLLESIAMSEEYRAMFSYVIPVPEIINLYLIFFNLILDTDKEVLKSFKLSKDVMASLIESNYSLRGKDAYKNVPKSIENMGGPKGIAQSFSSNSNFNKK